MSSIETQLTLKQNKLNKMKLKIYLIIFKWIFDKKENFLISETLQNENEIIINKCRILSGLKCA